MPEKAVANSRSRELLLWTLLFAVLSFLLIAYVAIAVVSDPSSLVRSNVGWALFGGIANAVGAVYAGRMYLRVGAMNRRRATRADE